MRHLLLYTCSLTQTKIAVDGGQLESPPDLGTASYHRHLGKSGAGVLQHLIACKLCLIRPGVP